MSKPVKNLIVESYRQRFDGVTGAVLVNFRGIDANANNALRGALAQNNMRVSVVKNNLAKLAWTGTAIEGLSGLVDGPSAVVFGGESVVDIARALMEQAKAIEQLTFLGALMEGQLFGPDQVEALSKYPTREEAQGQAVQLVMSPGQNVVAAALGPGRKVASLVKAIEDKLEKGEEINKV